MPQPLQYGVAELLVQAFSFVDLVGADCVSEAEARPKPIKRI